VGYTIIVAKFIRMKKAQNGDYTDADTNGAPVGIYVYNTTVQEQQEKDERVRLKLVKKQERQEIAEKKRHAKIKPDHDKLREETSVGGKVYNAFKDAVDSFFGFFFGGGPSPKSEEPKAKIPAPQKDPEEITR